MNWYESSTDDDYINKINDLTKKNQEDFLQHYKDFVKANPERNDIRRVFESWTIQRISAMEFTVCKIADEVERLKTLLSFKKVI